MYNNHINERLIVNNQKFSAVLRLVREGDKEICYSNDCNKRTYIGYEMIDKVPMTEEEIEEVRKIHLEEMERWESGAKRSEELSREFGREREAGRTWAPKSLGL